MLLLLLFILLFLKRSNSAFCLFDKLISPETNEARESKEWMREWMHGVLQAMACENQKIESRKGKNGE